jgi:hypothetical protein
LKVKINIFLGLSFLFIFSSAYAGWAQKPEFRLTHLYRYDLRQDFRSLYTDRISIAFAYLDNQEKPLFKLMPFFEIRRNVERDFWARKEAGIEIGKDIFSWFYLGESIQKVWMKEDFRNWLQPIYEKIDRTELETRLCFTHILLSARNFKLKGFLLDEYTFDFDDGKGTLNEVAAGVIFPIGKYIETTLNWRHTDRITYYDTDAVEASLSLVF